MNWGKTALYGLTAASLAVNVFILGVFVGDKGDPQGPTGGPPPPRIEFNMRQIAQYLSPKGRRAARQILMERRQDLRSAFTERRAIQRDIAALLTAEEVDVEALEAALARQKALSETLGDPFQAVVLEVIAKESPEVRRQVVKALKENRTGQRLQRPGPGGFGPEPGGRRPPPPRDGGGR